MEKKKKLIIFGSILLATLAIGAGGAAAAIIVTKNNAEKDKTIIASNKNPTLKQTIFTLEQFNLANEDIANLNNIINKEWIYKNSSTLFDNYEYLDIANIGNIDITNVTPSIISVTFKIENNVYEIKLVKSIDSEYGEINDLIKESQTDYINRFNNFKAEITNDNIERQINQNEYETDLLTKYETKGFKYPSWDYNYESSNNRYLDLGDGTKLDMMNEVYNERVTYIDDLGQEITTNYSNPNFIRNQIKNNSLKKHPAAKLIHKYNPLDNEKAIEKSFSISSSITGVTSLGIFVPAGEIATLKLSNQTYELMMKQNVNNLEIVINSSYWDNRAPGDTGQISNRYPFIQTFFRINLSDLEYNQSNGLYEYKFGSPFGGSVSININTKLKSSSYNDVYKSYDSYNFSIAGGLRTLSYYHGITTIDDWNNQISLIKNKKITSPNFALDFAYGSSDIPFTDEFEIAGVQIDNIPYLDDIMQKWSDFLFVSEYFASRDINENVTKISFRFNDDIWGGAGAWGGGNILYSPLSWAANSFLLTGEWTITNNWGTFHEINHNFQQNAALWIRNSHGETNQVTMANFSLLSDVGRWRNPYNVTSEYTYDYINTDNNNYEQYGSNSWVRMNNLYSTFKSIRNKNYNLGNEGEYEIYNIILNMVGPYNYLNYVRNDIAKDNGIDSQGDSKEGGFYEILELSDYFKLDFWPALKNYRSIWYDDLPAWNSDHRWPESYQKATKYQKTEIDRLSSSYRSFDFIANLYASGIYMYENDTGRYIYTGDSQPVYSIPAGQSYTFDFEKGISWLENNKNYKFSWSKLEFEPTSKLGANLTISEDGKKLTYTPTNIGVDQVDEFDIAIIPDNFKGKPSNYVDKYKWKIKVKQIANAPLISIYDTNNEIWSNQSRDPIPLKDVVQYMKDNQQDIIYKNVGNLEAGFMAPEILFNKGDNYGAKVEFNFVAPETGKYTFKTQIGSRGLIYDDTDLTNIIFEYNWDYPSRNTIYTINKEYDLKKGDTIPFTAFVNYGYNYQNWGGNWDMSGIYALPKFKFIPMLNGTEISLIDNVYDPNSAKLINDPTEFINNKKYHYKKRNIDYNYFQNSILGLNVSRTQQKISTDKYKFKAINPSTVNAEFMKEADEKYYETWNATNTEKIKTVEFDVEFDEAVNIGSISFTHRTQNHPDARPTTIKILDENNNILYDGEYGATFNDRSLRVSNLNLDKNYTVNKLKFICSNTIPSKISNNGKIGIIFDAINFNYDKVVTINKTFSFADNKFNLYGDWKFISNKDNENFSNVNNKSIKSSSSGDMLIFDLYGSGFDIVGQQNINNSNFELYINDSLIANINTNTNLRNDNAILYSYTNEEPMWMRIKIVNKSNNNLYLNYLQTFGEKVYLKEFIE